MKIVLRTSTKQKYTTTQNKQHHADFETFITRNNVISLFDRNKMKVTLSRRRQTWQRTWWCHAFHARFLFFFDFAFFRLLYPTMNEPVCHNLLKSTFNEKLDERGEKEKEAKKAHEDLPVTKKCAGYCSAYCINKDCLRAEIQKPPLKTSDIYATCNLPQRFEHPRKFVLFILKYSHTVYLLLQVNFVWGWDL